MTDCKKMMFSSKAQVVASLFLAMVATVDMLTPTYQWTDEMGKSITCQKCPPGTYMAKQCSSEMDTLCEACPEEHYTQYWNYLDKCRFCNVICQEGEQVKHECNSTHNRVCECQSGYHHNDHYCVKDLQCNFQDDTQEEVDEECDNLVIDYFVNLNVTTNSFRRLELAVFKHKGRKPISQKRIRNFLKVFKNLDPNHPLLPRLLKSLKEAKIHSLEKKLRKRFLELDYL